MPDQTELNELLVFAHGLADLSGAAIRPYFRNIDSIEDKDGHGRFDPVTAADRAAEKTIRAEVARCWPGHDVIGEEFGGEASGAEFCWLLDPIDGTRPFIVGFPVWGSLIGLLRHGKPVVGIMDQPFTGERFWASPAGAFYRGPGGEEKPLATRTCASIADAILTTTSPDMFSREDERSRFEALTASARMRWFGGDCYGYCMLAAGQIDVIVESGLSAYDIVPLVPIIEGAGGRVTTWKGGPVTDGGPVVACGDPALHDAVLEILAG